MVWILFKENCDLVEKCIIEICEGIVVIFGGVVCVNYMCGYLIMVNYEIEIEYVVKVVVDVVGFCFDVFLVMGGEDFVYMFEECSGVYILMGNGDIVVVYYLEYNFNDDVIFMGCSWFVEMIE